MAEAIPKFKALDGKEFDDEASADRHNEFLTEQDKMEEYLLHPRVVNEYKSQYIAHQRSTIVAYLKWKYQEN